MAVPRESTFGAFSAEVSRFSAVLNGACACCRLTARCPWIATSEWAKLVNFSPRFWLLLGFAPTILVLAFVACVRAFHWQLGDVAGWLSGLGSLAAVGVALWIAVSDNRRSRVAQEDNTRRIQRKAIRQAQRIDLAVDGPYFHNRGTRSVTWTVRLENYSDHAIYGVQWFRSRGVIRSKDGSLRMLIATTNVKDPPQESPDVAEMMVDDVTPVALKAGDFCTVEASLDLGRYPALWNQPVGQIDLVTFEDEDGNRLGAIPRVGDAVSLDGETDFPIRSEWAIIGEDYISQALSEVRAKMRPLDG